MNTKRYLNALRQSIESSEYADKAYCNSDLRYLLDTLLVLDIPIESILKKIGILELLSLVSRNAYTDIRYDLDISEFNQYLIDNNMPINQPLTIN